jgi:hypothetical protein
MDAPRRPLDRDDYHRTYAALMALQLKVQRGEDRPLWEILRDLHEQHVDESRVLTDELVGDDAAAAEVAHGLIVLEMLMRGDFTIRDGPTRAPQTVCSVSGCPNLTTTSLCLQHELDLGSR